MGYTTWFEGSFEINKEIDKKLAYFINTLANTRRMKRDVNKIKEIYLHWDKMCYNGNLGVDGEFFIHDDGEHGQTRDDSIINYNQPPVTQAGLWDDWIVTDDRKHIEWNGNEKFYNYVEWLQYIIDNFLLPNGYELSGEVKFQGEDVADVGKLYIEDNKVHIEYMSAVINEEANGTQYPFY